MKQKERISAPVGKPCTRCGREASQGRPVTLELDKYPSWVWLGFLLGLLPGVLMVAASQRPPRQFSFSLCPRCIRARLIKQIIASVAWAGFVGTLVVAIVTGYWELWGTIAFWLFFVAVFAAAASSSRLIREKELYRPHS
jgi:hypothetical protein